MVLAVVLAERVEISGPLGCHLWTGATTSRGYPIVKVDGRHLQVRRLVYEDRKRKLEPGERVTTDCGERACINPLHLHAKRPRSL